MQILQSENFIASYPDPGKVRILEVQDIVRDEQAKIIACVVLEYDGRHYVEFVCVDQDENCDARDTALNWMFWKRQIYGPKTPPELISAGFDEFERNVYRLCYK